MRTIDKEFIFNGSQKELIDELKLSNDNGYAYTLIARHNNIIIAYSFITGKFVCIYIDGPDNNLFDCDIYDFTCNYSTDYKDIIDIDNWTLNNIEKILTESGASEEFIDNLITLLNGIQYFECREFDI